MATFKLENKDYNPAEFYQLAHDLSDSDEQWKKELGQFVLDWMDDSDHIGIETSGTTGTPKQLTLSKHHMKNSARVTGEFFKLEPGSSALLCLPVKYIAGKMMLVRAFTLDLNLTMVEPASSPLSSLPKGADFDFAAMVPQQAVNSIGTNITIRNLIVGGNTITPYQEQVLMNWDGNAYATYGMTETCSHVALKDVKSDDKRFHALPGVAFETDEESRLLIHAPAIADYPVLTCDVVSIEDNSSFTWLGRFDNIINSGGVKISPEVVEEKIAHLISDPFFIHGFDDAELGQKVVLIIEANDFSLEEKNQLIESFREVVDAYELPREILCSPAFQRTESVKIQRNLTIESLKMA